jgi:hypothetical protein
MPPDHALYRKIYGRFKKNLLQGGLVCRQLLAFFSCVQECARPAVDDIRAFDIAFVETSDNGLSNLRVTQRPSR